MIKKLLYVLLLISVMTGIAYAAGSVTETITWIPGQNVKQVKYHWVADGTGEPPAYTAMSPLNGYIRRFSFDPGTTAPTAGYNVYLMAVDGQDEFGGDGTSLSATATQVTIPTTNYYSGGAVGFSLVGNTDVDATGDVYIYVDVPR